MCNPGAGAGLILGVDTSNYTTSLCALDAATGQLVAEARRLLPVATGASGLRQSEALFFHVQQLPAVMAELRAQLVQRGQMGRWRGVGVSVRPRPLARSYMPVFQAGWGFAQAFAQALGLPLVPCSHQEGHLAAAAAFLPRLEGPFLAVHLSGGTSDVLLAEPTRFGYRVHAVAPEADLHAGQLVDRVGVALGLPFPAGPALERLAAQAPAQSSFRLPSSPARAGLSFSGPCTAALRALARGVPPAQVALAVQVCIAHSVAKVLAVAAAQYPQVQAVVVAGGVAANADIQQRVRQRLRRHAPHLTVWFAPARFASDNALGPARIAWRFLQA
ncbi:MAG: peptidase M22 [Alicyclobacillus sp.]|nr:peptidase M22 [Alicyclobacillus sp.]